MAIGEVTWSYLECILKVELTGQPFDRMLEWRAVLKDDFWVFSPSSLVNGRDKAKQI